MVTAILRILALLLTARGVAHAQGPPEVTSTDPTSCSALAGESVGVHGRGFQDGATVLFGDVDATEVRVLAASIISAVVPAHPPGVVDVIVTNPDGQSGVLEGGFEYTPTVFESRASYGTSTTGGAASSADLDGDGDKDVVAANYHAGSLSVLMNRGDGVFVSRTDYSVSGGPGTTVAADLDADGDEDLVVTNYASDEASVLLNRGDGTFTLPVAYSVGATPNGASAGDLDGDGDLDLAVANPGHGGRHGSVSVLMNEGDGTFAPAVGYDAATPTTTSIADLDGDGDNDLAASSSQMAVWMNSGDGSLAPRVEYEGGDGATGIVCVDLDGDEYLDITMGNSTDPMSTVSVFINAGDGTYAPRVTYPVAEIPSSVVVADMDGDDVSDIVACSWRHGVVSVLLNRGDGTFPDGLSAEVGYHPRGMCAPDLDADGDRDLVVGNAKPANSVTVLLNGTVTGRSARWNHALPDTARMGVTIDAGSTVELSGHGQWGDVQVVADLSALGAQTMTPLVAVSDSQFLLAQHVQLSCPAGSRVAYTRVSQVTANGTYRTDLAKAVTVLAAHDMQAYGDELGPGWGLEVSRAVEGYDLSYDATPFGGLSAALFTTKESFSGWYILLESVTPVDTQGYAGYSFAFRANELAVPAAPRLTIKMGEVTVDLLGEGLIDLADTRWQEVVIPAQRLAGSGEIVAIQLYGNFSGKFCLDEMRLAASDWLPTPGTVVSEESVATVPEALYLSQNYPNPFNSSTTIRFDLAEAGEVELALYNLAGQLVAMPARGSREAGTYALSWDGRDDGGTELASGVYLYRLVAGGQTETRKLLLLR